MGLLVTSSFFLVSARLVPPGVPIKVTITRYECITGSNTAQVINYEVDGLDGSDVSQEARIYFIRTTIAQVPMSETSNVT